MRKSLGNALKNVFEEITMKNVPIDQFQSFKSRNGVQNHNRRKKLSKIGHFRNFNFWSKVNAKVKVNESKSQLILVRVNDQSSWVRSRWFGSTVS